VILGLIDAFPYLEDKSRKEMTGYLNEYFSLAEKEEQLMNRIRQNCR
jgi:hypothetical protein